MFLPGYTIYKPQNQAECDATINHILSNKKQQIGNNTKIKKLKRLLKGVLKRKESRKQENKENMNNKKNER